MTLDPNNPLPDPSTAEPEPEGSRWWRAHHLLLLFTGIALVGWIGSGFYVVGANEVAIVERLGEYVAKNGNGPHLGLPWPIDIVHKIPIAKKLTLQMDDFNNVGDSVLQEYKTQTLSDPANHLNAAQFDAIYNAYLVTGDKNMLNASVTINYQIDDASKYLLGVATRQTLQSGAEPVQLSPEAALELMLRQCASRVLIRVMGTMHVDGALTERRDALVSDVRAGLQDESDTLNLGIFIASVNISVTWPPIVNPAFSAVPNARQESQQRIERAKAQAASQIAKANGDASGLLADANGYSQSVVDAAKGEKARFDVIRTQYESAGIITTQSLFSDAMTTILKNVGRTYVVQPGERMQLFLQPPDDKTNQTPGPAPQQ